MRSIISLAESDGSTTVIDRDPAQDKSHDPTGRASTARSAAGCAAMAITGHVLAVIRGIRSTREEYAPPVLIIGLRPNASLVSVDCPIRIGIGNNLDFVVSKFYVGNQEANCMPREAKLFSSSSGSAVRGFYKFRANIPPRWIKNARNSRKRMEPDIVKALRSVKTIQRNRPRAHVAIKNAAKEFRAALSRWETAYNKENFYRGIRILLELQRNGSSAL